MGPGQEEAAEALVAGLAPDAPVGIAVYDAEGRFVELSESIAAIAGSTVEAVRGRPLEEFFGPEVAGRTRQTMQTVLESGEPLLGREQRDADGERTWIVSYHPIQHAGRRLVGVVAVEITDRRRAEDALHDSERLLAGAQRMARMGWWAWRPGAVLRGARRPAGHQRARGTPEHRAVARRGAARGPRRPAHGGPGRAARAPPVRRAGPGPPRRRRDARLPGPRCRARRRLPRPDRLRPGHHGARARRGAGASGGGLSRAALAGAPLDELLQRGADTVAHTLWVEICGVMEMLPGDEALVARGLHGPASMSRGQAVPAGPASHAGYTYAMRAPVVVEDWEQERRFRQAPVIAREHPRSGAAVVIGRTERPFGVLAAQSVLPGRFGTEEVAFMQAVANVLAGAIDRRRAQDEIEALSDARGRLVAQTLESEEGTRRAISELIHDGALQDLLAVGHDLYALAGAEPAVERAHERLRAVAGVLREAMGALHPTVLQYGGLGAALSAVADQQARAGGFSHAVAVDADATGVHDELLLSLARALLGHVARIAGPRRVTLAVRAAQCGVVLEVADEADSLEPGHEAAMGIATSRERAEALGGRLTLEAAAEGGSRAVARLPAPFAS